MIQATCADCGLEQSFGDYLAGMRVHCRNCSGWIQLPSHSIPSSEQPFSIAAPPAVAPDKVDNPKVSEQRYGAATPSARIADSIATTPDAIQIGFSPLRSMRVIVPFGILVTAFVIWQMDRSESNITNVLQNFAGFVSCIRLVTLIGWLRMSLTIDAKGLTIRYLFSRRTYTWIRIESVLVVRQTFLYIPAMDIVRFWVAGDGSRFVASVFQISSVDLANLIQQKMLAAQRPAELLHAAEQEAVSLSHEYVGSEHLLLAIAADTMRPAGKALNMHGASRVGLAAIIGQWVEPNPAGTSAPLPCTQTVNQVLDHAVLEARRLGHDRVEPEHVLFGILAHTDCVAHAAILTVGVTPESIRAATMAEAGWHAEPDSHGSASRFERAGPWLVGLFCGVFGIVVVCLICGWLSSIWNSLYIVLLMCAGIAPGFLFLGGFSWIAKPRGIWPVEDESTRIGIGILCGLLMAISTYLSFVTVSHTWSSDQLPAEKLSWLYLTMHPDEIPDLRQRSSDPRRSLKNYRWLTMTVIMLGLGSFSGHRISKYGSL